MNPNENPTPVPVATESKFKKFLIPGLIIILVVVVGLVIFGGKSNEQGAALFKGVSKTQQLTPGTTTQVSTATPLNCLSGSTNPQIKVMSPNGGETFTAGQQITVKWQSCNLPGNVMITLIQPNSGGFAAWTLSNSYQNSGQAAFTLPMISQWGNMMYGKNFKIMIGDVQSNGTVQDQSDNLFTIDVIVTDVCPNIPGIQATVPQGYQLIANDCIPLLEMAISQMTFAKAVALTDQNGQPSTGIFQFTFQVRNDEPNDIYIDNSVGLNATGFVISFPNGTGTPYGSSAISAVVSSSGGTQNIGNSYKINSGDRGTFTVTGTLDPLSAGQYRMKLDAVKIKNAAGVIIGVLQPAQNGPVQTVFVQLQ